MARKKTKNITYDSKEFQTIIGLVFLILSIIFLISIFSGDIDKGNIFYIFNSFLKDATVLGFLFTITISFKFLGVSNRFTKTRSVFFQGVVYILLATLLSSSSVSSESSIAIFEILPESTKGGILGYFFLSNIFGTTIPTNPFTNLLIYILLVFFTPLAISVSHLKILNYIKKILIAVVKLFAEEKKPEKNKNVKIENPIKPEENQTQKASRFGDFNQILEKTKLFQKESKQSKEEKVFLEKKSIEKDNNLEVKENTEINNESLVTEKLLFPDWKLPPLSLLTPYTKSNTKEPSIKDNASIIEQILSSFGIDAKVEDAFLGPSVIQYAVNIPLGVKVPKVAGYNENIALALGVDSNAVRIEPIQGSTFLGIEIPRTQRETVRFKEIMEGLFENSKKHMLPVPVGKNIGGGYEISDISSMPHLLIAGATGSGKSVVTNSFITSLLMKKTPDELRLILVDPKQVELTDYNGIPHLLTPVITDMDKVVNALKWAVNEMETRYTNLAKESVRNIAQYNEKKGFTALPYIVIVIDEMADMMMTSNKVEAENAIVRIAQKARAVGIHLILATQRPSVNVITGIIKANIPGRIGMSVTSSTDSRVILDRIGAEALMGKGDLLFKAPDSTKALRLQGPFIDGAEITRVVEFIKSQAPNVEYLSEITEKQVSDSEGFEESLNDISGDNLIEQAIHLVARTQKGSASYLQRRLSIGFNRAARLLDELEDAGVVGPANGSKPREVLISDSEEFISQLRGKK